MRGEIGRGRALANGLAILAILGLAGLGIARVSARQWRWQETFHARAEFATIGGVEVGAKVRVQGIDAGVVESIVPPAAPGRPVALVLRLDARLRPLVRADATARVAPQGVVGAHVVEVTPGQPDAPALPSNGTLRAEPTVEVADLLRDARTSIKRIDEAAAAATTGLGEINAMVASVRRGEGTLGRLLKDDEAYRKLLALASRGEQAAMNLDDNLGALKQTWPISRYFNRRGFDDRDRVLYQPGSDREDRVLAEADLFAPGRAMLTATGRSRLDEVARWFRATKRPATEVVIAAFTDEPRDEDLAQILTQEQADAVRNYLVKHHNIDASGWFGRRKVAAVGFGSQTPRPQEGEPRAGPPPSRRDHPLHPPGLDQSEGFHFPALREHATG